MNLEGKLVKIPSCRLYSDSFGKGPSIIIPAGIYYCTRYIPDRIAPMNIEKLGWIKCFSRVTLLTNPPIYLCKKSKSFKAKSNIA